MCECSCFVCIREMEAGIVQQFGKFNHVLEPGLNCICFPMQSVVATMSLKVQQLDVTCDTKTRDNVFVQCVVSVQYRVLPKKVTTAYYKFTDPRAQIRSYVFDVIRGALPTMNLDDVFASKDEVAHAVRDRLSQLMGDFGFEIIAALLADISPDKAVKDAMNEINASQRLREAAAEKAEAEKILQVKSAEADAESKYLSGLGVARQRKAIVEGLKDTVNDFATNVKGSSPQSVMDLLLITQYFDVMREISKSKREMGGPPNSIFLPHGPKTVKMLKDELAQFVH